MLYVYEIYYKKVKKLILIIDEKNKNIYSWT